MKGQGGTRRPGLAVIVVALSLFGAGCYSYTPVSPATVSPGSSVRIRVTQPSTSAAGTLSPGVNIIRGTLLPGSSADTLLCAVALTSDDARMPSRGLRSTVLVPVVQVERLEVRRLQKGRTVATIAAAALTTAAVINWAFDVTLPDESNGDPGGVNNLRRGLFHLHW